jgi:hypothetical protein
MQIENYINVEKLSDTAQKLLNNLREANKAEVAGVVACVITAQYVISTFVLDRLSGIPGPFAAKLSRFYDIKVKASGKSYLLIDELHKKYGNVVRTGRLFRFCLCERCFYRSPYHFRPQYCINPRY